MFSFSVESNHLLGSGVSIFGGFGWTNICSKGFKLDLGLSRHCREDNRILETMIVATIVAIVATIKKIAKLLILKAKFKEINHII